MAAMLIVAVLAAGFASAIPVSLDEVKVDGTELSTTGVNRLDVVRGDKIDVRIELSSPVDLDNVEVEAAIFGYEYNDRQRMSDTSHTFDLEANVTYVRKLSLTVPIKVDEDDYQLRIRVSDRNGISIQQDYSLKIDVPRHGLEIKDVVLSPETKIKAGRTLTAKVRIKNVGEKDEEGIRVKVAIPALGVSESDYIDELDYDDAKTSEELWLEIPRTAAAGTYTVQTTVEFDEGYESVSWESTITVVEAEEARSQTEGPQTVIGVGAQRQDVTAGESGVIFPLTITNNGAEAKSYTIAVNGADQWASVAVNPANTAVLQPGEAKAFYIYVSANEDAAEGEHMFSAVVSSGAQTLKEITFSANVVAGSSGWDNVAKGLEVGLIVLVVLIVIIGLIIGFNKLKGDEDEDLGDAGQTYY